MIFARIFDISINIHEYANEVSSLIFARIFDISINIHEYANEVSFILTHNIYIFVIYGITGAITSCHNDSFGPNFVYIGILKPFFFSAIFYVFIKIHEYANSIICITYQRINVLYLCFTMRPVAVI